jgi:pimeloyl-ACP methyl ester carboxylesterase
VRVERATVDGVVLEYEIVGVGEPVVLIHGVLIADAFRPLMAEESLIGRYRLIGYHRRGYAGSERVTGPVSVERQAADCRALLEELGVNRAHLVGHSYGGAIALQLALDAPEVVHSLALLEPALFLGGSGQSYRETVARSRQEYADGDPATVVDGFLRSRMGAAYRSFVEPAVPGAFAQAVADAATTFEVELPALLEWRFGEAEARRIGQPVLAVLGEASDAIWPRFGEVNRLLLAWLPRAERFVLPGATHALQLQNPGEMARALARFLAGHPMP